MLLTGRNEAFQILDDLSKIPTDRIKTPAELLNRNNCYMGVGQVMCNMPKRTR